MPTPLLSLKTTCKDNKGNHDCVFRGHDLFLTIHIVNNQKIPVEFPLAFRQQAGPVVRLVDRATKAETYLRTNPANLDLLEKWTTIAPAKAVALEWVISKDELQQFGAMVDLSAEITVMAHIKIGGVPIEFRGTDTLQITGKAQP